MKSLIVTLVGGQASPNIQFIKEIYAQNNNEVGCFEHLFISTPQMEIQGVKQNIIKALHIEKYDYIKVDEYSEKDIINKLNEIDFDKYNNIYVNITGGTKIMSTAARLFFKEFHASVYYATGRDNKYVELLEDGSEKVSYFTINLSLMEYLYGCGFSIVNKGKQPTYSEIDNNMFKKYCSGLFYKYQEAFEFIRERRSKSNKKINETDFARISNFINELNYSPNVSNKLSENEVKYITGDWFEDYIGYCVKTELNLDDDAIAIGVELSKEINNTKINPVIELLGDIKLSKPPKNEFDIMFMYNNKFHVIECKSSIISNTINEDGKKNEHNILGETIYKVDSLNSKFGLFATSYIFTLTDFKSYIIDSDKVKQNNKTKKIEGLINRATVSKITIADKDKIQQPYFVQNILHIKK